MTAQPTTIDRAIWEGSHELQTYEQPSKLRMSHITWMSLLATGGPFIGSYPIDAPNRTYRDIPVELNLTFADGEIEVIWAFRKTYAEAEF